MPLTDAATRNGKVLYAWRIPIMHFFVAFCLYQQALSLDRKHRDKENIPAYIRWIRSGRESKQRYWEMICDLKRQ